MQVDIFHRMFEFYTTSYTHFENRAEDILIYLEEMGDCVKKEIIQEDTLYTQECDMYHFESKFARQCQERIRAERGYHFQITEEQEEEYFSHIVDADVLFCVMYAHWIGLDKGKINCIKKAKTEKTARKRLKESLPIENIYYIDSPEGEVTAYKLEEGILVTESGERYESV